MNTQIKSEVFSSMQRIMCIAKVLEFEQMEKMPKQFQSQSIKNHARKIKESSQQIMIQSGTIIKTKSLDDCQDYTYALWRIFDKLIGSTEEELITIANGLVSMDEQQAA